jgi:hypothetical protein
MSANTPISDPTLTPPYHVPGLPEIRLAEHADFVGLLISEVMYGIAQFLNSLPFWR